MQSSDPLTYIVPLVASVVVSMAIIPVMKKLAPHMGLMDRPDERKIHKNVIPRVGGIGIVIGSLLPVILLIQLDKATLSYILGSLLLFFFGLWDDKHEIGHYTKFFGQFVAALVVVMYGGLYVTRFPFFDATPLPIYIGIPFTIFAIIGMINAMNHSDGLDGLAGGESLISLVALAVLFYIAENESSLIIALAVIGGIYGFMRYNTYPARVFMGDNGSQFLGFTLAYLVLVLTQWVDRSISPTVVLLLLGLPIIDIIVVLIKRIRSGMNWFLATRNHFHHRLLDIGFVHWESVVIIYTVQALSVTAGVLLRHHDGWIILIVYLLLCVGLLVLILMAERKGWKRENKSSFDKLATVFSTENVLRYLVVFPRRFLSLGISLYLVVMSFIVITVPRDFAIMSVLIFGLMSVEIFFGQGPRSIMRRALIYIIAVSIVYLGISFSPDVYIDVKTLSTLFFTLLAIAFAVAVKFSPNRRKIEFNTTPMDYLVVMVLIATLIASKGELWGSNILLFVVKMIIILYTCELLLTESREQWNTLSAGALVSAIVLSIRGFL